MFKLFLNILAVCALLISPVHAKGWQGLYFGLSTGSVNHSGQIKSEVIGGAHAGGTNSASLDMMHAMQNGMNGLYFSRNSEHISDFNAGYNWINKDFLFGVEAAWSNMALQQNAVFDRSSRFANSPLTKFESRLQINEKMRQIFVLSGRLGYVKNRFLIYGRLGLSAADIRSSASFSGGVDVPATLKVLNNNFEKSAYKFGIISAIGLEYQFFSNWRAKVEYSHINFGENKYNYTAVSRDSQSPNFYAASTASATSAWKIGILKIGVVYNF